MTFWCTECLICNTKVGENIGGYIIGVHLKKMIAVCDGCKFMMEECIDAKNVSA